MDTVIMLYVCVFPLFINIFLFFLFVFLDNSELVLFYILMHIF